MRFISTKTAKTHGFIVTIVMFTMVGRILPIDLMYKLFGCYIRLALLRV